MKRFTIKQLKEFCKSNGIHIPSKYRKGEIIEYMRSKNVHVNEQGKLAFKSAQNEFLAGAQDEAKPDEFSFGKYVIASMKKEIKKEPAHRLFEIVRRYANVINEQFNKSFNYKSYPVDGAEAVDVNIIDDYTVIPPFVDISYDEEKFNIDADITTAIDKTLHDPRYIFEMLIGSELSLIHI